METGQYRTGGTVLSGGRGGPSVLSAGAECPKFRVASVFIFVRWLFCADPAVALDLKFGLETKGSFPPLIVSIPVGDPSKAIADNSRLRPPTDAVPDLRLLNASALKAGFPAVT